MSDICPRCTKTTRPDDLHTCSPSLASRVDTLEDNFHDMAEKLFTRIEILEDKISHLYEVTNE